MRESNIDILNPRGELLVVIKTKEKEGLNPSLSSLTLLLKPYIFDHNPMAIGCGN